MKNRLISILVVIMLILGGVLFFIRSIAGYVNSSQQPTWTPKLQLEYANVLLTKGLNIDAAQAFETYLNYSGVSKKELAGICNKLGNIYMDLKDYEKALASFYKSELLDSNADYKQEMSQKIVQGLESLGLSQQAQYELENRTSVKPAAEKKQNVIIKIGKREITKDEVDAVINNFPEPIKKELSNEDAKLRFIRGYAASEALYEKGKKMGLDKNLNTRMMVEDFKKKLVLQELLRNTVDKESKITPEDVALYYKANKDRYHTPERAKVSFLELSDLTKSNDTAVKLKQGKGEKIEEWIEKGTVFLPHNLGESKEAVENIFKQQKGSVVNPIQIKDKFYMFIINEKEHEKEQGFDEVKQEVEDELRIQKQQQIARSLMDKALEEQEVEILFQPKKTDEKVSK